MRFSDFVYTVINEEKNLGETMEGVFAIAVALHMAYGRVDTVMVNTIRKSLDLKSGKASYTIDPNIATDNIYGVDADADDRLARIICRDILERGRSVDKVLDRYEKTVKPMHLQFIEPTKRFADIIIPQGGNNEVGINVLASIIKQNLKKIK